MSAPRALGLVVVSSWLVLGCGDSSKKIDMGTSCVLNSDCNSPLSCSFGKCHDACKETRDCLPGERCVKLTSGSVCQLPGDADCQFTGLCGEGLVCAADLSCRSSCQTAADCLAAQTCVGGVCADPTDLGANGQLQQKGVVGAACVLDGDCNSPMSCIMSACHYLCQNTNVCPKDQSCLKTATGAVCQLPAESGCDSAAPCPVGLVCAVDARCRAACKSASDCTTGQVCTGGVCADKSDLSSSGQLTPKSPPDGGADAHTNDSGSTDLGMGGTVGTDGPGSSGGDSGTGAGGIVATGGSAGVGGNPGDGGSSGTGGFTSRDAATDTSSAFPDAPSLFCNDTCPDAGGGLGTNLILAGWNSTSGIPASYPMYVFGAAVAAGTMIEQSLLDTPINDGAAPWCTSYACCSTAGADELRIWRESVQPGRVLVRLSGGKTPPMFHDGMIEVGSGWHIAGVTAANGTGPSDCTAPDCVMTVTATSFTWHLGTSYSGCVCSDCSRYDLRIEILAGSAAGADGGTGAGGSGGTGGSTNRDAAADTSTAFSPDSDDTGTTATDSGSAASANGAWIAAADAGSVLTSGVTVVGAQIAAMQCDRQLDVPGSDRR